ncbi:hypothetical protein ES707_05864 [subsurface metagenome]
MVIRMKRITLIGPDKISERLLTVLQHLGVVDIIQRAEGELDRPEEVAVRDKITKALKILRAAAAPDQAAAGEPGADDAGAGEDRATDPVALCDEILRAAETADTRASTIAGLEQAIADQRLFGEFDLADILALRDRGVHLQFWSSALPFYKLEIEQTPILISRDRSSTLFATPSTQPIEAIPKCTEAEFNRSVALLENDLAGAREELLQARARLECYAATGLHELEEALVDYENRIEYRMAACKAESHVDGAVFVLSGWCPVEKLGSLGKTLDALPVHLMEEEPERDDDVPTAVKNGPFTRLFEPIMRMFMLPDYFELDLTALFAPFFMLFFGLCLGDAGWGLVLLAGSVVAMVKAKTEAARRIFLLGLLFAVSTIIIGLLTGTLMGFKTNDWPVVGGLAIIDADKMFIMALTIGIVQILAGLAAKTANAMRDEGFLAALYPIGTMLFIVALAILAAPMVAENFPDVPSIVPRILAIGGLTLILLFNTSGNILKRVGSGLYAVYNIVTGFLGDTLSYIRLFALGLAGSILGFVINEIGSNFLSIDVPVLNYVIYVVFLIVLHGFMLLLSALGAFVHPLRLTFVEFYKNAGFKGTLHAYKPFAHKSPALKDGAASGASTT